jgi:streptogramin lyase
MANASFLAFEPSGRIVVTDEFEERVFRVNPRNGNTTPVPAAGLGSPFGIDRAANGDLMVIDVAANLLRRIVRRAGVARVFASGGLLTGSEAGIETLANGTTLVTDRSEDRIVRVSRRGSQTILSSDPLLDEPEDIARAPDGTLFVVDSFSSRLLRIHRRTRAVSVVASGLGFAVGVAPAANGMVYTTDLTGSVRRVNPRNGNVTTVASTDLTGPAGIEVEPPRCFGKSATIVGSTKRDKLPGSRFADVIAGLQKNDVLRGKKGKDRLCGSKGNDRIRDPKGKNKINCGPGKRDVAVTNRKSKVRRCERVVRR